MKRVLLAAALAAASLAAFAQQPEIPKHACGAAPAMPGRNLMNDKMVRRTFDEDLRKYRECMMKYVDERNAVSKAHLDAANAAIDEYNAAQKKLIEAQEALRGGKREGASPKAE